MGIFKRHWPAIIALAANLPSIWRAFVWLFDWEVRIETIIAKFQDHGGLAAMFELLLNPPPWLILITLPAGLLLIWWDAKRERISPRAIAGSIADEVTRQKTEFHLSMSGGNVFIPDEWPDRTGIGLDAEIWNTGAPSIVTSWSMRITPNGGQPVIAQPTKMPNVLSATGEFNSARLLAANSLELKTKQTPVGITPVSGVLLFYVSLPKNIVSANDTSWELTAKDIYEKEVRVSHLVGDWQQR